MVTFFLKWTTFLNKRVSFSLDFSVSILLSRQFFCNREGA